MRNVGSRHAGSRARGTRDRGIALNLAEGMYSRGNNRQARYHNALGSARETLAGLEVAEHCR